MHHILIIVDFQNQLPNIFLLIISFILFTHTVEVSCGSYE